MRESFVAAGPPGVLVEDYVPGLPVTVGLLELPGGILAFPPLATRVDAAEFYDAPTKLGVSTAGNLSCTEADLPAPVLAALTARAPALWDGLGCRGMARIHPFMVTQDGAVFALEVNTTPGMSYESNFLTAAGLRGLGQAECCPVALQDEGEFAG